MTNDKWYIHCCVYDASAHTYDVDTLGPYDGIQRAFDMKSVVASSKKFDFIEVNQNGFMIMPTLV